MSNYPTTATVLASLETILERGTSITVRSVCRDLSIFDWWKDRLSVSDMRAMRTFLRTAKALGYNGYVCFKVGVSGCASGMWAYVRESDTGYSPDGDFMYRSFQSKGNYWDIKHMGMWLTEVNEDEFGSYHTVCELKAALAL